MTKWQKKMAKWQTKYIKKLHSHNYQAFCRKEMKMKRLSFQRE